MTDPKHVGRVVRCEGCGAEIRFVSMANGKQHPVEAKARVVVQVTGDERGVVVRQYESHFGNCPQADMFRRGG